MALPLGARFAELDGATAVELLQTAGIAHARVNSVQEMLDRPVLWGRDRWRTVATPGGPVRALLPPATLSGTEPRMDPVPAVGEHATAVRPAPHVERKPA